MTPAFLGLLDKLVMTPGPLFFHFRRMKLQDVVHVGQSSRNNCLVKLVIVPLVRLPSIGTENVALEQNLDGGSNRMSAELTAPPLFSSLSIFFWYSFKSKVGSNFETETTTL